MTSIKKATLHDTETIAELGRITFLESHGNSASQTDIEHYINEKYSHNSILSELSNPGNIYHLLSFNQKPAGYSKIIFNCNHPAITAQNITKLDRIYIRKDHYDKKLGLELFKFNLHLSKNNNQAGMWLYVWKENQRALTFYLKNGFEIIGSYDFKISADHSNPNHLLYLTY